MNDLHRLARLPLPPQKKRRKPQKKRNARKQQRRKEKKCERKKASGKFCLLDIVYHFAINLS